LGRRPARVLILTRSNVKVINSMEKSASLPPGVVLSPILKRFLALLIDYILLCAALAILGSFTFGFFFWGGFHFLLLGIAWLLYFPILEASRIQGTLGKHVFGIRVINSEGNRLTLKESFIRNLTKVASGWFLCAGYIVAFFTARKQTLHDFTAGTYVVLGTASDIGPLGVAWVDSIKDLIALLQKSGNESSSGSASGDSSSGNSSGAEGAGNTSAVADAGNHVGTEKAPTEGKGIGS
jgi:uncharacterized RDD family membrane protein YckC